MTDSHSHSSSASSNDDTDASEQKQKHKKNDIKNNQAKAETPDAHAKTDAEKAEEADQMGEPRQLGTRPIKPVTRAETLPVNLPGSNEPGWSCGPVIGNRSAPMPVPRLELDLADRPSGEISFGRERSATDAAVRRPSAASGGTKTLKAESAPKQTESLAVLFDRQMRKKSVVIDKEALEGGLRSKRAVENGEANELECRKVTYTAQGVRCDGEANGTPAADGELEIVFIRHGQTDYNLKRIIQGHSDVPLNDVGRHQAELAADRLAKDGPPDCAYCSDLARCIETTDIILSSFNGTIPVVHTKDLRERYMGELEHMKRWDALVKVRKANMEITDFGETLSAMVYRVNSAWDNILDDAIAKGYHRIVVVSHGCALSNFFSFLVKERKYDMPEQLNANVKRGLLNTSFTTLRVDSRTRRGRFLSYGDGSHMFSDDKPRTVDNSFT